MRTNRRLEIRHERRCFVGIVNELAHVISNDAHSALALYLLLLHGTTASAQVHAQGGLVRVPKKIHPFTIAMT